VRLHPGQNIGGDRKRDGFAPDVTGRHEERDQGDQDEGDVEKDRQVVRHGHGLKNEARLAALQHGQNECQEQPNDAAHLVYVAVSRRQEEIEDQYGETCNENDQVRNERAYILQ
jgi:hypothetical protein